jgi:hypothetical protein
VVRVRRLSLGKPDARQRRYRDVSRRESGDPGHPGQGLGARPHSFGLDAGRRRDGPRCPWPVPPEVYRRGRVRFLLSMRRSPGNGRRRC